MLNKLFNHAIKGKNNGSNRGDNDDDDDHDDDDDDDKRYREFEARKKEYKDENNLDPSVKEELNEIVRYSENLYITGAKHISLERMNQFILINLIMIMKKLSMITVIEK